MKRVILMVTLSTLLVAMSGCSLSKDLEEGKTFVDSYYDAMDDNAMDEVLSLMHQSLIEDIGGADMLTNRLYARRMLLGPVKSREVTNSSFETAGGETEVVLEQLVTYESYEVEEIITVFKTGDQWYVSAFDLGRETIVDEIAQDFFEDHMNDDLTATEPLWLESVLKMSSIEDYMDAVIGKKEGVGAFKSYELYGEEYWEYPLESTDAVSVYGGYYEAEYEVMNLLYKLEMAVEDQEVGICFMRLVPSIGQEMVDVYIEAMNTSDMVSVASLYHPDFFVYTDKEAWIDGQMLDLATNYGSIESMSIEEWMPSNFTMDDGIEYPIVSMRLLTKYRDLVLEEIITYVIQDGQGTIISHDFQEL